MFSESLRSNWCRAIDRWVKSVAGFGIALALVVPTFGQEFKNSIASTDFDFITEDDPSTFALLEFEGLSEAELPDKRDNSLWREAYGFSAFFSDNTEVTIFVDAAFGSESAAREEALRYVHPLGKLPTALRRGVNRLCVHNGGEDTTAFSDIGLIVVYAGNASIRIANHDLEETIFHESVHAAWDDQHAGSEGWKRAQKSDGNFVTVYARSHPELEDLAETALFAYTLLHHPDRIPVPVSENLRAAIPARIQYVAGLLPPEQPVHYPVSTVQMEAPSAETESEEGEGATPCNVDRSGYAADIISHCLLVEFEIEESEVRGLLVGADDRYESGEEVFRAALDRFRIDPATLKQSVIKNLHQNCNHDHGFDDTAIRAIVESWQTE